MPAIVSGEVEQETLGGVEHRQRQPDLGEHRAADAEPVAERLRPTTAGPAAASPRAGPPRRGPARV